MIATVASAIALVAVLKLRNGVPRRLGILFVLAYAAFLAIEVVLSRHG